MIRSCQCGRFKVDTRAFPRGTASEEGVLDCPGCRTHPYTRKADPPPESMPPAMDPALFRTHAARAFAKDVDQMDPLFRHLDRSSTPELSPKLYRRGRGHVEAQVGRIGRSINEAHERVYGACSITPELLAAQAAENARRALQIEARGHSQPRIWRPSAPRWFDFALPLVLILQNVSRRVTAFLRRS